MSARPGFSLDASGAPDPMASMKILIDRALAILRDPHASLDEKRRQLHAVARDQFDLPSMARGAMGDHWDSLSASQRTEYVDAFDAFIEEAYLNKIQDYSGQEITLTSERMIGPNRAEVDSTVIKAGEEPFSLNFLVEDQNGIWKIYDFIVDDISTVENYRAQFKHEIDKEGFEQLMAVMQQKQRRLAEMLGQK
ncbi:MAG TPA: ABC transporter substrate-binding protein [Candidatus Binataceae bacterium]|nr:ABC transporter substrate-binding protein [Candidatus Binataceae bacterium]